MTVVQQSNLGADTWVNLEESSEECRLGAYEKYFKAIPALKLCG